MNPARKAPAGRTLPGRTRGKGSSPTDGPPARVRIIGGLWKRTPLPVADLPGLRPTPDRIRETLFNWLGQDLAGWRCLDAFAGSGALGFEAASRGAGRVVMIEREPKAVELLRRTRDKLHAGQIDIVQGDVVAWLRSSAERFDLILLDPPFQSDWAERVLPLLEPLLEDGGLVYLESDRLLVASEAPLSAAAWLRVHKADRAGRVYYHLLRHSNGA